MIRFETSARRGFTLIELAIVLAIAGIITVGLWRLVSGGNQQLRDQSAANLQAQLINSTKAYLASANGQTFLQTNNATANPYNLALPPGGACTAGNFCSYLPSGFTNVTTNAYNQRYVIQVIGDGGGAGITPNTYSFMVLTTGGLVIPDTSGGRISAMIGGDGGFVYTNTFCGAPANQMACGSYGAWSANLASYGFGGGFQVSGNIASRTYVSPEQDSSLPWLARQWLNANPGYNTMSTDLYMTNNTNGLHGGRANVYMAPDTVTSTGGGSLNMAQGTINMQGTGGALNMAGSPINMTAGTINMQAGTVALGGGTVSGNGASNISLVNGSIVPNPPINVGSGCAKANPSDGSCPAAIQVSGDVTVSNLLSANSIYSLNFIYTSDARLKTDIHPLENSLANVMKLNPVSFRMKWSDQQQMGVLAQELEKVYPELVTHTEGMRAVSYEGLIGPLIGAVQDLKRDNDALRAQLQVNEEHTRVLEDEMRGLKKAP